MGLFEPKLMGVSRKKFSNALVNDSFAASFTHLKLGKDHKEDDREVGESQAAIELQPS